MDYGWRRQDFTVEGREAEAHVQCYGIMTVSAFGRCRVGGKISARLKNLFKDVLILPCTGQGRKPNV